MVFGESKAKCTVRRVEFEGRQFDEVWNTLSSVDLNWRVFFGCVLRVLRLYQVSHEGREVDMRALDERRCC